MNRREFLRSAAAAAVTAPLAVNGEPAPPLDADPGAGDALNPPGIRLAGVKMVPVVGGKYKVWTKKMGSGPVKVLLLHGGPGVGHEYLEAMESFLPEAGIEMYYYDQLGNNFSDVPDDPSLWTVERYTEEVEEVRRGLGLDPFVLYGHSFGGILAIEYALKYPQHLRAVVISNMAASTQAYLKRTDALKVQMLAPEEVMKVNALEAAGNYDAPEYAAAMKKLYALMLCRTQPWPNALERSFKHMNETIYVQMQGKSEFVVTGNLKDWDRWDRLHEIHVKALTLGARYDEMDPEDMKKMARLMPNATYAYCPNGSHMAFWDDQQTYFRHLLGFLKTV
ncbi:MAG: proline iminopeptidase-family hydrolase, partial [Verrucomicrobiota bacterium]